MKALIALTAILAASSAALPTQTLAGDYTLGALTIRQPWSRPAQAGMNGAGFFTVVNAGKTPVTLRSVDTPAAAKAEIHQSSMANGVMSMRRLDNGVVIPAGGQIAFAPGGYHLMLIGLKAAQAQGQKVPVTLIFDSGRKMRVDLAVQLAAPSEPAAPAGGRLH
uniref:copper chaperone PCu(A)C n=1 Tax=uncultured Caulobacter sp. TaxID=158749 RepID=UPI0025E1915D|nr:copper chaperone PCu(A)C [uncultured Caulobacter sp.]